MVINRVRKTAAAEFKEWPFKGIVSYGRVCMMVNEKTEKIYIVKDIHDYSPTTSKHVNEWTRKNGLLEFASAENRRFYEGSMGPRVYYISEQTARNMLADAGALLSTLEIYMGVR